jgi:hypothetical protein
MGIEEDRKFVIQRNKTSTVANDKEFDEIVNHNYNWIIEKIVNTTFLKTFFEKDKSLYQVLKDGVQMVMKANKQAGIPLVKFSSQNPKFIKTAIEFPEGGIAGLTDPVSVAKATTGIDYAKIIERILQGDYQGVADTIVDGTMGKTQSAKIVKAIIKFIIPRIQRAIQQSMNPEMIRRLKILDTANEFDTKRQKHVFSPSAYQKILNDKGYNNQELSQGAYDARGKDIEDEIAKFKKSDPEKFKHEYSYYDDPDVQERLEKGASSKFTKVSQSTSGRLKPMQRTKDTDKMRETLIKLTPPWTTENLKQEMLKVANRTDITDEQKTQLLAQVLNPYIKSVEPLHNYLNQIKSGK